MFQDMLFQRMKAPARNAEPNALACLQGTGGRFLAGAPDKTPPSKGVKRARESEATDMHDALNIEVDGFYLFGP